jgi:XrtJ-associated TM-motif-TM protein
MNLKKALLVSGFALMFAMALPLHAQEQGCDDSPENPTMILGLVAGAGALGARLCATRHSKQ